MIPVPPIIELDWEGPFAWPSFETESALPPLPSMSGIYLQTFGYNDGYLIYGAGLTRRRFCARLQEHTRKYLSGDYTVLDPAAASLGLRQEVWHGWGYARAHRAEFVNRKDEIHRAVRNQLSCFRIFVTDAALKIGDPRALEPLKPP